MDIDIWYFFFDIISIFVDILIFFGYEVETNRYFFDIISIWSGLISDMSWIWEYLLCINFVDILSTKYPCHSWFISNKYRRIHIISIFTRYRPKKYRYYHLISWLPGFATAQYASHVNRFCMITSLLSFQSTLSERILN